MPQPKRVLVTGVSSFVGAHLANAFAARGASVTAVLGRPLDRYEGIRAARLATLRARVALVVGDLEAPADIAGIIAQASPDLLVHHAGHATGYGSPDYDLAGALAVNVLALDPIYRALAGRGCGVIITGSSAEYSASDRPNAEDEACLPDTPYGLAKLAETLRARQLAERFDVPTRVARLFIPFGRLDHPDKLLSQVVTRLARAEAVALSPCTQARDFVGVGDVCEAWWRLALDLPRTRFDVLNICSGEGTVLRDLLLTLAGRMGADAGLLQFGRHAMRPGEAAISCGDNAKARRLLGWAPAPLAQALERDLLEPA